MHDISAFTNRLGKNAKHLLKWARRQQIEAWRLYDRDIPQYPFAVDVYGEHIHLQEYDTGWLLPPQQAAAEGLPAAPETEAATAPATEAGQEVAPEAEPVPPAELPASAGDIVGRRAELHDLDTLRAAGSPTPVLVTGTAGMKFEITPVDIMVFDDDGKIAGMRAVWEQSDLKQL